MIANKVAAAALVLSTMLVPVTPCLASDSQLWTGGSVAVKLSSEWSVSQDVIARFSDKRNGLYELETNTLLGFRVSKNLTLSGGYTHDPQYSAGHFTIMEHRAVQASASRWIRSPVLQVAG